MANQGYGGFDPQTFAAALQSAKPEEMMRVYQLAVDPQMKMLIEMEFNRRQEAAQAPAPQQPGPMTPMGVPNVPGRPDMPTYDQRMDQSQMPRGPVAPSLPMMPMQGIEGGFSFGMAPARKGKPTAKGGLSESDKLNMAELQRIRARQGKTGLLTVTPTGPGLLAS